MLRCARELDDAILHLRNNEYELGVLVFRTQGDPAKVAAHEKLPARTTASTGWRSEILLSGSAC